MAAPESIVDRILAVAGEHDALVQKVAAGQQASDTLKTLNSEIAAMTRELDDVGARAAKLDSEIDERRAAKQKLVKKSSGMRSVFRSKDAKQARVQLAFDEVELGQAMVDKETATREIWRLEDRLDAAKKKRSGLKAANDSYIEAANRLEALYAAIFDGPTPDLPEEDALEALVKDAEKKRDALLNRVGNISKTINSLYMAKMRIKYGMDACTRAFAESEKELKAGDGIGASPINGVVNAAARVIGAEAAKYHQMWWVYKSVGEARDLVASSSESGDSAAAATPFAQPYVAGGDAVAVDYETHQELKKSLATIPHIQHEEIVQTMAALAQVQTHLEGEIARAEETRSKMAAAGGDGGGVDSERAALEAAADAARKRLTDYRGRIFSVAVAKSKEGTKLDGAGLAAAAGLPGGDKA